MVLEDPDHVDVGMLLEGFSDAVVDVFPARQPRDFLALRLRLAGDDRLLQSDLFSFGERSGAGGQGAAGKSRGNNEGQ